MTTTPLLRAALAALVVLALGACGEEGPDTTPGDPPADLGGTWQLVEGRGPDGPIPLVESHPVTLELDEDQGTVGGTAACNAYGGDYEVDGDRLAVSGIFQTEMACIPDEVMDTERAYLSALPAVEQVTRDGDRLVLAGPDVRLEFAPAG